MTFDRYLRADQRARRYSQDSLGASGVRDRLRRSHVHPRRNGKSVGSASERPRAPPKINCKALPRPLAKRGVSVSAVRQVGRWRKMAIMLNLLTTQALAAFTLALLGGLHCAGMCGGFVGALQMHRPHDGPGGTTCGGISRRPHHQLHARGCTRRHFGWSALCGGCAAVADRPAGRGFADAAGDRCVALRAGGVAQAARAAWPGNLASDRALCAPRVSASFRFAGAAGGAGVGVDSLRDGVRGVAAGAGGGRPLAGRRSDAGVRRSAPCPTCWRSMWPSRSSEAAAMQATSPVCAPG